MNTRIINTQNCWLKSFIQSYIFFSKGSDQSVGYTTFPNTNLCLALYKNNQVNYSRIGSNNQCIITRGKGGFQSRLYGFHQIPFRVDISAPVDQVCILFHPGALRAFSAEPFQSLMDSDHAFDAIFPGNGDFLSRLFEEDDIYRRVSLIESLLIKGLVRKLDHRMAESLFYIKTADSGGLTVGQLADRMNMDKSTLYRLFSSELGGSPKAFLQTIRFRGALDHLISNQYINLNQVANASNFFDLAHFAKEIKSMSGRSPGMLKNELAVEQTQLAWIFKGDER